MKIKHKIKLKIKELEKRLLNKGTPKRKNNSRRVSRLINYDQIDRNLSLKCLTTDILGAVFLIPDTWYFKKKYKVKKENIIHEK